MLNPSVVIGLTAAAVALIVTGVNGPFNLVKTFREIIDHKVVTCPLCCSFWATIVLGLFQTSGMVPFMRNAPMDMLEYMFWTIAPAVTIAWMAMAVAGHPITLEVE